jgi:hypothetical protein
MVRISRASSGDFGPAPINDLWEYPLAFVEVQERAFCGNSERHAEREHIGVKIAASGRGLKYAKPAYTCARKRHHQAARMLADSTQRDWVLQTWRDRSLYRDLLCPKYTAAEVNRMSIYQRHAVIYGYDLRQVFADTSDQQRCVGALTDARELVQHVGADELTTSDTLVVNFLKNHFVPTSVFSVPHYMFEAVTNGIADGVVEPINEGAFLDALLDREYEPCDISEFFF